MKPFKRIEEQRLATGFVVPENYFDDFQHKITTQAKSPKAIALFSKKHNWRWAVAAIFMIGLCLSVYKFYPNESAEIDTQSAENYLLHEADLNSDELAEYLNDVDLNTIKQNVQSYK